MIRTLVAWMNGERVGTWTVSDRGAHSFSYDVGWVGSERGRALSLSLPFPPDPATALRRYVGEYFDNLLPDNDDIRERIRRRFGARSRNSIDLLTELGRDSIGALQLLPPDASPDGFDQIHSDPISDDEIAEHLRLVQMPHYMGDPDDVFRISLAGAQEKTALLKLDGQWRKPRLATPSTHILKLPLGRLPAHNIDLDTSVENEWLCGELLRALGLPVAASQIATFGEQRVLVVERFDREITTGADRWIQRLPQEDFCQATGTASDRKYNEHGGPGIDQCLTLLAGSEDPTEDSWRFLAANFAFWLLAAPDGHAKNFSIFIKRRDAYGLTPFYDVLSAWPVIGNGRLGTLDYRRVKLAMAVRARNPHWELNEILPRHWKAACDRYAHLEGAWDRLCEMSANVDHAIDAVARTLPRNFPGPVWEAITTGMQRHSERFQSMVSSGGRPRPVP